MRYEDMKQRMVDIDLLEKDLMRDLTVEEKDLVATEGFEALMKQLHLDLNDLHLVHRIKGIIGLYLSGESEEFDKFVKKEDNAKVIDLLEDILSELKNGEAVKSEPDMIEVYADRLKKGETLELDEEVLDKVVDYLWETEDNVRIEVRNNKIRLR